MSDFLTRDPLEQFPPVFKKMKDIQHICKAQQTQNAKLNDALKGFEDDMFFDTASEKAIKRYEAVAKISANPRIEDLEFRRKRVTNRYNLSPPFTTRFFADKLNEIIGVGKWKAYLNSERNVFTIESSAVNQQWFEEIQITINKLKPASLLFINKPMVNSSILTESFTLYQAVNYNYKLGAWKLGEKPFGFFQKETETGGKMSIEQRLLNILTENTVNLINTVLINDKVSILAFVAKNAENNTATIEYKVMSGDMDEIHNIKFLTSDNHVITNANVYIPLVDDVMLKHIIKIKEG